MKKNHVTPQLIYMGLSRDNRTNLWQVMCSCGKIHTLPTTMFSASKTQCNKCGKEWSLDYNKEAIIELKI